MLKGTKVTLRPIEKEDLKELFIIKSSKYVRENVTGTFLGFNQFQMLDWFESINNNVNDIRFIIIDNKSSKIAGMTALYKIDPINKTTIFGIYMSEELSGEGRGTEATKLITDFGFKTLNINKIFFDVLSYNKRAIRVYEKLGFRIEGVYKKHTYKNGNYIDTLFMAKFIDE